MWSALEIKKGSNTFYDELEKVIKRKIFKVKDEEFQTLLSCFTEDRQDFSERFLEIIIKVIHEKKDRF